MQIVKKDGVYTLADGAQFPTHGEDEDGKRFSRLSDAVGHAHRLAICHYFRVVLIQLRRGFGRLTPKELETLNSLDASVHEVLEEKPDVVLA